jgi:hypothetical protein
VKKGEEAMEILEAYDLAGTLRGAAALAGCDHKTVARLVAAREAAGGGLPARTRARPLVDPFAEKIDELVDRPRAQIRRIRRTGCWSRWGMRGPIGRRGGRSRTPSGAGGTGMAGGRSRGSRSRGCGCSSTTATVRWWPGAGRCCSARGWRGRGSGWWCRWAISISSSTNCGPAPGPRSSGHRCCSFAADSSSSAISLSTHPISLNSWDTRLMKLMGHEADDIALDRDREPLDGHVVAPPLLRRAGTVTTGA